ncbi:tRNA (adenosine(37)-N6)-threonylcarbamoyltransferase complex ATPase subunit type 1 TsaE [Pullulanibacillus sp. KACC 23026]|uniref:tRNA (adenosine(37)-N6)-threonylcarbamoyltransferase complex ATPase subunit type 1 TsaE n=1 Tax=Pullulanibacillus sp. KACC 23026 TaxID=3028315 RepID=UPI0023AED7F7|nr:tRNA (adenosine(37)-N6)-threonylcarbamoyltransferase complex ATPase subunit type 1 TsaE [Pullulanibacillus sp. KACC 23026]WEG15048.1 tRNA (adenosine(37)-N6)-threonylcarbamoyltransferase complex ATPase subunit type 1 TsaE [Pullulanibacillus sp. KACC 23026]
MTMIERTTASTEETMKLAEELSSLLKPGMVLTLEGGLGAGKTTFTKGLAKGLGVQRMVNSPTFTIIKEYQGTQLPLYHMDVYRLDEESGEDLGFDDYFYGDGITVVEWPSQIESQLPSERLEIRMERLDDELRQITLIPHGERMQTLCQELNR